jgi:two-component system sensor histidine kinase CiaH
MFKSARIKLTSWYLLIIMMISVSFSAFIYRMVTSEFQRRFDIIERRWRQSEFDFMPPPPNQTRVFIEDVNEAKRNVFFVLVYTNGFIATFAGVAGYFLAGKTLRPIEKAMDEQKRFVADASHELKTPLTALTTTLEVSLRDKALKLPDAKKTIGESLDEVANLTKLTNSLLSLGKYQMGKEGGFAIEKIDTKIYIENVAKKLSPISKKKGVELQLKLKKIYIKANRESFEKLVTILIDNAIKFTPKGGTVSVVSTAARKCFVMKIKDTGVGIAREDIPYIFDRFYRVDHSRSKIETDGFGLGLSVAKEIVKLHGGEISVESKVSKGSTFSVKLPKAS